MSRLLVAVLVLTGLAAVPLFGAPNSPVSASTHTASSVAGAPNMNLYADGWDPLFHSPFGAVRTDSKLTLNLRSSTAVSSAALYLQTQNGANSVHAMHISARTGSSKTWSVNVTMPSNAQVMTYYFGAKAGKHTEWYGDNQNVGSGGPGETYGNEGDVFPYSQTVFLKSFHEPKWMDRAVIYQIFPDRFDDGNKGNDKYEATGTQYGYVDRYFHTNWSATPFDGPPCGWSQCYSSDFYGGDLQGVIDKLHYLKGLGINAIYLNPIFEAPSDHKYDTGDFMKIDPGFGTLAMFKTLIADATKDGIHLILDGVFEDTGTDSLYFNEYGQYNSKGAYQSKNSPYYSWYTFTQWPTIYNDWMGVGSLALLNENSAVENYFFKKPNSVAQYWLGLGTAGWRLDSADTLSSNYWRAFRKIIKAKYANAVIIGEKNGWTDALPWLLGDQWDGMMNYQFRDPVLQFFANGVGANSPSAINASAFMEDEMQLLAEYPRPAILSSMNLVDSHDVMRVLTSLGGNKQALRLVALYQMTWLGAPTILYGDETGIQGTDNNTARATFPWQHQDKSLESYYSAVIHMRLKYPALTVGSVQPLLYSNRQRVVAYMRQSGHQQIVVALNDSGKAQTVKLSVPQMANGTRLTSILAGNKTRAKVEDQAVTITLHKLGGTVLLAGA